MENLSLEERVLYSSLSPSIVDVNMLNGKTDVQYLEEGSKIIQYFKESLKNERIRVPNIIPYSTRSQKNFIDFFGHLKESWNTYLDLSAKMASLSENLKFLYPEKLDLFRDLTETTFRLNIHIYYITDIEKEIYEKGIESLPEDRALSLIQSVKSFPVYLSEEIGESGVSTKNPYEVREMLSKKPNLRKLFFLSGSSINSFGNLLEHFAPLNRKSERETFTPENDYESALKEILAYDHFFELFLRESGILMNDLKFYIDLSDRLSCTRNIPELLDKLDESKNDSQTSFNPKIPSYTQTSLSCGATCLANTISTYFPNIAVTRSLEEGIHKLVTVPGFFNNLDYLESRSFKNDFERRLFQELGNSSGQFAVRSSADIEDSGQRSYAGQFKTILDVSRDGIVEAIKQVYDSGINFNSPYSNNFIQMGIIIQKMIDAENSGVLFTYDLINQNNNSIMAELSQGKCENIVSGRTNPSLYIIDKNSRETLLFEKGNQSVCLNQDQVYQILSNAKKIESIFGKPQDIEFLFNSDKFYCLQSRDITTI